MIRMGGFLLHIAPRWLPIRWLLRWWLLLLLGNRVFVGGISLTAEEASSLVM